MENFLINTIGIQDGTRDIWQILVWQHRTDLRLIWTTLDYSTEIEALLKNAAMQEEDMAELTSMMNIGGEMAKKLDSVGIGTAEELACTGAEQAFLKLKERYPNVCLVHLYALEGAICNMEFNSLPESRKKELKEFSDFLKR